MSTRTLIIVRHAKAASPEGLADFDRPLTDRGHADAAAVGAWLESRGLRPDLVLCSPARRTRETWHGAALSLSVAPEVRYEPGLYTGDPEALLDLVRAVDDSVTTVVLIGHNPTVSQLAALLDPDHADAGGLRTAGISAHTIVGGWVQCGPAAAPLVAAGTARDA